MSDRYAKLLDLIDAADAAHIGYDQGNRWAFWNGSRIVPNSEGDCSAVTAQLYDAAGYTMPAANMRGRGLCYTGNVPQMYPQAGLIGRSVVGQSVAHIEATTGPGDSILGDGHVMIKGRNGLWFSMNQDENGGAIGGRTGEQVPNESGFRPLWNRHGGWLMVFSPADKVTPAGTAALQDAGTLSLGSTGDRVKTLQQFALDVFPSYAAPIRSTGGADGTFGAGTQAWVREFQARAGLQVDGIVGPATYAALRKAGMKA